MKRGTSGLTAWMIGLGVAAYSACGGDFDPASRVTSLRVLAVQADQTWGHPGEKVNLQALWSIPKDPKTGTEPDTQWAWATCVDPDSSTVLGCFAKIIQDAQKTGIPPEFGIGTNKDTFSFTVPSDALSRLPPEARRNAIVGVITIVCPGTLSIQTDIAPSAREVPLKCTDGSGNVLGIDGYVAGIKRVFVREKDRNANPKIAKITWDGQPWEVNDKDGKPLPLKEVTACDTDGNRYDRCTDADHHDVALVLTDDSYEAGTDEFGVAFEEQVIVEYYATEGLFEHDVRVAKDPPSAWVARTQAKGTTVKMWFVAHDNRGGTVWDVREVHVK